MRIYLDNCCYNRPYDDFSQLSVNLEAQAKLHIQEMIRQGEVELVTSYILNYENSQNRVARKKDSILEFMQSYSSVHVDTSYLNASMSKATEIMDAGIKQADALHTACAIIAGCDYMLTTDDRLLKYQSDQINIVNPTEFVRLNELKKREGGKENE